MCRRSISRLINCNRLIFDKDIFVFIKQSIKLMCAQKKNETYNYQRLEYPRPIAKNSPGFFLYKIQSSSHKLWHLVAHFFSPIIESRIESDYWVNNLYNKSRNFTIISPPFIQSIWKFSLPNFFYTFFENCE